MIGLMIRRQLPGFHEYFNQLKEKYLAGTDSRNPWYEEYYRTYQQCSHNTNRTMCHFKERFKKIRVKIRLMTKIKFDPKKVDLSVQTPASRT